MSLLKYMRADERVEAGEALSLEPLSGSWLNTNSTSRGIARADLSVKGNGLTLRVAAAGDPAPHDWGETDVQVFAADTSSAEAMAFSAFYDFGFMETLLQGHVRQGVLIIAKFDTFKDNSGRSSYFSKEFFFRA